MALQQCEDFMNSKGYIAQTGADTAGSAKILSETKEEGLGVIASELAAEMYGLEKV
jgi:prephenate dehydratase